MGGLSPRRLRKIQALRGWRTVDDDLKKEALRLEKQMDEELRRLAAEAESARRVIEDRLAVARFIAEEEPRPESPLASLDEQVDDADDAVDSLLAGHDDTAAQIAALRVFLCDGAKLALKAVHHLEMLQDVEHAASMRRPISAKALKLLGATEEDIRSSGRERAPSLLRQSSGADADDKAEPRSRHASFSRQGSGHTSIPGSDAGQHTSSDAPPQLGSLLRQASRRMFSAERSAYLAPLFELIGPRPSSRTWRDEWVALNVEYYSDDEEKGNEAYVRAHAMPEQRLLSLAGPIAKLVEAGWPRERAQRFFLLNGRARPLGRSLLDHDDAYAASLYDLSDAFFAQHGYDRRNRRALPPMLYRRMTDEITRRGLADIEPGWLTIEQPDAHGFCGFTSVASIDATCDPMHFSSDGFLVKHKNEMKLVAGDIVGFVSADDDQTGGHAAVITAIEASSGEVVGGTFPPNTLFRLKKVLEAGTWVAPGQGGRCRPNSRLLVVTATYRPPQRAANPTAGTSKMCESAIQLQYGKRDTYVAGLGRPGAPGLLSTPLLTMAMEMSREHIRWTDWKGKEYSLKEQYEYVLGPALPAEGTPGLRDANNAGKTPEDFMREANEHIARRRAQLAQMGNQTLLPSEYAFLTLEELLAVRLYSGPAYQPINEFLRGLGALQGASRTHLERNLSSTFTATVTVLCGAIRKLAAVTLPEDRSQPLYRGVRGDLPRSFWIPDEQGLVCAVDSGFFSTSRHRVAPMGYMHDSTVGRNVLWELWQTGESDVAFHAGADISVLSQFAMETEVLFPPCTMLQVIEGNAMGQKLWRRARVLWQRRQSSEVATSDEKLLTAEVTEATPDGKEQVEVTPEGKEVCFTTVRVRPSFI